MTDEPPKLHKNTKLQQMDLADMRFEYTKGETCMTDFTVHLPDGNVLRSNFCQYWDKFKFNKKFSYFLIDSKDFENMERMWSRYQDPVKIDIATECFLGNLVRFTSHFPKHIYARVIPYKMLNGETKKFIFTGEVLDIIPAALKLQGTPIESTDMRLLECKMSWMDNWHRGITIEQFETVLENFDIDKSRITLVPDPSHEVTRREYQQRNGHIRVFAPDMKVVSDNFSACMFVFESLVMGENWNQETEDRNTLRQETIGLMTTLGIFLQDKYIDCSNQCIMIQTARISADRLDEDPRAVPNYFLHGRQADNEIYMEHLDKVLQDFDLQKHPIFVRGSKPGRMPIWVFRVLVKLAWIQQFFKGDHYDPYLMSVMIECLYFHVPEDYMDIMKRFLASIFEESKTFELTDAENKMIDEANEKIVQKEKEEEMREKARNRAHNQNKTRKRK
ncbi:hypothetical protein L3Y34_000494 [Caenorhabditis briggsae]|uniref:Uncharacterized protein n=1 Tax=Caenorhabditis briggsae TaxID=6238 RepID=A0AAE9IM64_CAEBR|nr:hypothetical protein L3Y34_000494 [Caenorhabditis briggsae]